MGVTKYAGRSEEGKQTARFVDEITTDERQGAQSRDFPDTSCLLLGKESLNRK
jgi:hypothetical protein